MPEESDGENPPHSRDTSPDRASLKEIHVSAKKNKGQIAAVDPDSGRFFLGLTVVEAARKARQAIPGGTFYFIRIGHRTAHVHHGGLIPPSQAPLALL